MKLLIAILVLLASPCFAATCGNCNGTRMVGASAVKFVCPICEGTGEVETAEASSAPSASPVVEDSSAEPRSTPGVIAPNPAQGSASQPLLNQRAITADDLPADAQPTPWPGVSAMVNILKAKPEQVVLDPGCGPEARLLIETVKYRNIHKAVGYEINAEYAEAARRRVDEAGLSDRIEIRTGDSLEADWSEFDVALLYMWESYNAQAAPKLRQLDAFVSYGFNVPGIATTPHRVSNGGVVYSWQRPAPVAAVAQVPVTQTVKLPWSYGYRTLPRGSYCEKCGGHCNHPMAHKLQQQIVGYQTVTTGVARQAASGHWETRRVCQNGVCRNVRTWVPH